MNVSLELGFVSDDECFCVSVSRHPRYLHYDLSNSGSTGFCIGKSAIQTWNDVQCSTLPCREARTPQIKLKSNPDLKAFHWSDLQLLLLRCFFSTAFSPLLPSSNYSWSGSLTVLIPPPYLPIPRHGVSIPFKLIAHYLWVNAIVAFRSIADYTVCQGLQNPTDMKGILLTIATQWNLGILLPLKRISAKPIGTRPFLSDTVQRPLRPIEPKGLQVNLRIGNANGQVPFIAKEKLVVCCLTSWTRIYCWAYQR